MEGAVVKTVNEHEVGGPVFRTSLRALAESPSRQQSVRRRPTAHHKRLGGNAFQPCRCLCRGLLQTTNTTPRRRMILQFSQILLTLARTFMVGRI